MKKDTSINEKNIPEFISEYKKIVTHSENSVTITTEWCKNGDFFQKLSLYDNSYSPILTLGSTTLIKSL